MNYYIIPQPFQMEETTGSFFMNYTTEIILDKNCDAAEYEYAKLLAGTIKASTGVKPVINKGAALGVNEIYFERIPVTEEMPKAVKILLAMEKGDATFRAPSVEEEKYWRTKVESYQLEITPERVVIRAEYPTGMLYGVQTLRQLVEQAGMVLPCLKIVDKPAMVNRGFYHDATRGRIQTMESYKKLADKLSYYKQNQLQLYVEHSYLFRNFSEVWRDDTPLTAEDIMELDAYCRHLGIELVPSIASFGHLDKVLKTKSFAHLCELEGSDEERFSFIDRMAHHTINVSDERSWDFIRDMLDEFMALFSSRQFNLCADETFDLGKGRCKDLCEELGTHQVYVNFVKKICNHLLDNGLRPMFWGDIIIGSPELMKELPETTICLNWGYGEEEGEHNTRVFHEVGAVQYVCPGIHGWRHAMNRLGAAYANVSRMCSYAHKYETLGLLNTDWGDFGHVSDPLFSIPGMIYGAEGSWNANMPSREELNRRISVVEYGDKTESIVEVFTTLGEQEGVCWEYLAQYREYCTNGREKTHEQFCRFFGNMHVNNVATKNVKLAETSVELVKLAGGLNERGRSYVSAYLVHARGQMIMNTITATVGKLRHQIEFEEVETLPEFATFPVYKAVEDPTKMAAVVEKWFLEFKENWRVTCRESEMYRIQIVMFFWADLLRDLGRQ